VLVTDRGLARRGPVEQPEKAGHDLAMTTARTMLDLLLEIQERTGVSYTFISHDLLAGIRSGRSR